MATFNIQLDRRKKLKKGLYILVVRVNMGNDMIYLNIAKITVEQYNHVFIKKAGDEESISFREKCEGFKTKCERIYNKLKPFNKTRFREQFYEVEAVIPRDYEYPFSEIGYRIRNFIPTKLVMENEEIKSVVDMKEFDSPEQEYTRDIWLLLYRCNGSNFVDLLRMRWNNMNNKEIRFYRKKTETTRKKNVKQITVPRTPGVNYLLEKIGNKDSLFVLGLLQEGYSEETIDNKSNKMRMELNVHLKAITRKLNLNSPLRINKARECFASTLNRANKSVVKIAETMGHSTVAVTINYYIGGMNNDELYELNDALF